MELVCPALVISLLVYLKSTSSFYEVNPEMTQFVASPIYPGLLYDNGAWVDEKQEEDSLAADMQPFLSYVGYRPIPITGENDVESRVI